MHRDLRMTTWGQVRTMLYALDRLDGCVEAAKARGWKPSESNDEA